MPARESADPTNLIKNKIEPEGITNFKASVPISEKVVQWTMSRSDIIS